MTPQEFREAIKRMGYSQEGFAEAVGAGKRSGQRWATEAVPPVVETLVRVLEAQSQAREILDKIRPKPDQPD